MTERWLGGPVTDPAPPLPLRKRAGVRVTGILNASGKPGCSPLILTFSPRGEKGPGV